MDELEGGHAYFVIDELSKDRTLELCRELAVADQRFRVIWAPENRNVVHAYLRGFREAVADGFEIVIERDAGMSHDPRALPAFLRALHDGTIRRNASACSGESMRRPSRSLVHRACSGFLCRLACTHS
jgi:dolichol-phosphate mannosyltransferase